MLLTYQVIVLMASLLGVADEASDDADSKACGGADGMPSGGTDKSREGAERKAISGVSKSGVGADSKSGSSTDNLGDDAGNKPDVTAKWSYAGCK